MVPNVTAGNGRTQRVKIASAKAATSRRDAVIIVRRAN
jgi:hypothetical protein